MVLSAQLKGVIRLQAGTKVQVHGLEKKPELNGLVGECLEFDAAKMRWGVQLPDGAKILLKMSNLRPLEAEVSDADAAAAAAAGAAPAPDCRPARRTAPWELPGASQPGSGAEPEAPPAATAAAQPAATYAAAAAPQAAQPAPESPRQAEEEGAAQGAAQAAANLEAHSKEGAAPGCSEDDDPLAAAAARAKPPPRTGRWWQNESAAAGFAEQLRANDPTLVSLCLVPPKRFDEPDVEEISAGLEANTFCKELLASGHSLSELSCERLARALRANSSLTTLSLGDSSLGDRASILFEGLGHNVSLTSLDLEHKGLTAAAGRSLAEALTQRSARGAPALDSLLLSRNTAAADALEALASGPAPKSLQLCECGLSAQKHAAAIGRWVAAGIEELDLRGNSGLGAEGLEFLLAGLPAAPGDAAGAPALRKLRLDGCAVGDDGAEALAEAIKKGSLDLEELSLETCEVTAAGCEVLARALGGRRLARLGLRANDIQDEGCLAVASCAERLDLSSADVGPQGLGALARQPLSQVELFNNAKLGLSVSEWCASLTDSDWPALTQMDMSCCGLGNEGFHCLCTKLLEQPGIMPNLESLCLGGNDVDDAEESASHTLVDKLSAARCGRLRVIWRNG